MGNFRGEVFYKVSVIRYSCYSLVELWEFDVSSKKKPRAKKTRQRKSGLKEL